MTNKTDNKNKNNFADGVITPWGMGEEEVISALNTSLNGLSSDEAAIRQKKYGKNAIEDIKKISKLKIFIDQFKSPLIFILVIAGMVALIFNDWRDSLFIFSAVLVNVLLGFYQENKAENALEHLKSYLTERVRVSRDGKEIEIDTREVVPGDIVHILAGMRIPADARIISEKDFMVDESILTGESLPVKKISDKINVVTDLSDRKNIIFGGTLAVQGVCTAVVYATGRLTEFGKIAEMISSRNSQDTPLQRSIKKVAWNIVKVVSVIIVGIFILGILRGEDVLNMFLVSVAVAVGAIPEGLPIALTVILAVGVERLAKRNGIVRKLVAAEALGSTTTILTDKTGTLTKAEMRISEIIPFDKKINPNAPNIRDKEIKRTNKEQKRILTMALANTDVVIENEEDDPSEWRLLGRALEKSLVKDASRLGVYLTKIREKIKIKPELIFNSKDKFSATRISGLSKYIDDKKIGDDIFVFFGAPDVLAEMSNLNKDEYISALKLIDNLADNGNRVLGVAHLIMNKKIRDLRRVKSLSFDGLICFRDPLRDDAKEYVKKAEKYGVRVAIVTGDHKGTAVAVAKQLGWEINDSNVLDGYQIRELSDDELKAQVKNVKIFARVSPEDKVRIVKTFKSLGEVVAMTGDGVNDAPSLREADIGISVGAGTDVSKDVADLVLADNKFETIVCAIEEGRKMMANIRKAVVYLLSDILDEIFLIGGSIVVGLPLPLNALQILWVNFFSDSFPAIAYAFEDNKGDYKKSVPEKGGIFIKEVKYLIFGVGVITSIILFALYWGLILAGYDSKMVGSFIFVTFGVYTLVVSLSLRSLKSSILEYNVFSNKYLIIGVLFGIVMMFAAMKLPFFVNLFGIKNFPNSWWLMVIGFSIMSVFMVELVKKGFYKK